MGLGLMGMNSLYNYTTMECCEQENTCGGGMSQVTIVCAKVFVKHHLVDNIRVCNSGKKISS